jgi:hypothetical protein
MGGAQTLRLTSLLFQAIGAESVYFLTKSKPLTRNFRELGGIENEMLLEASRRDSFLEKIIYPDKNS